MTSTRHAQPLRIRTQWFAPAPPRRFVCSICESRDAHLKPGRPPYRAQRRTGRRDPFPDEEYTFYEVDIDRSKNSASDLRYDDLDNQLLNLGLCSACASNAPMTLKKPKSKCGKLVKAALEGNRKALEAIKDGPDYCDAL